MKYVILYSEKDLAGVNIAEQLKKFYMPDVHIIELEKDSVYNENIDKDERLKNAEFIIFATKHQSKAGTHSLSLHAPGNWRNSDFGGKQGKVCMTSALALKYLFQKLNENAKKENIQGYEITMECTHHGPFLEKPCCFIEIGSSEEQWKDEKAGEIIAKTIFDFHEFDKWKANQKNMRVVVGVGGPHYCPNFNKIQLNSKDKAISHVIPEYALPLTENMIREEIEKTKEHVDFVMLDWKGCGNSESRKQVLQVIEKTGIKVERV